MEAITKQLVEAAEELIAVAKAKPGQIFVVGCSTKLSAIRLVLVEAVKLQ